MDDEPPYTEDERARIIELVTGLPTEGVYELAEALGIDLTCEDEV